MPVTTLSAAASFDDLLARHARERPQAVALRFEGQAIDYAALVSRLAQATTVLQQDWGVRKGDRVAWLGLNQPDQIALLFALARLGAVLVPLNFRLAPPEWDAVLADCTPNCVVHDDTWREAATALAGRAGIVAHDVAALATGAPAEPVISVQPPHADAPALLVYTSGTTGRPRGALHTQRNLLANMAIAADMQALTASDVVLTVLPMFHVGGLCIQTLPALFAGATVILHPRFEPGATLHSIVQDRPTLTLQVPATMKALIEHPDWLAADLSGLRAVWAGSSTLPAYLVAAFHARGMPVCNVYGSTETGPCSIGLGPEHAVSHAGSCGWPLRGVEVRLEAVADGVGEVCVRASNVAARYWPELPALDALGWFHSGDLARQATDGSFTIVGRAKDMIISGGENIYPAELEGLLAAVPGVAEVAVVGLPHARWGEEVVAVVVAAAGRTVTPAQLQAALEERVARYKQPRRYLLREALPRTALGKVQKARLVAELLSNS